MPHPPERLSRPIQPAASESESDRWMHVHRHGIREHRPCKWLDDLIRVIGPGPRCEILQLLAVSEMAVSAIAKSIYLRISTTSHHLRALEQACLVEFTQVKNSRIYRLTDRVRIARKGESFQFSMITENSQLVLFQTDSNGELLQAKPVLPDVFIDADLLAIIHNLMENGLTKT